jgi:hypothetical protein
MMLGGFGKGRVSKVAVCRENVVKFAVGRYYFINACALQTGF